MNELLKITFSWIKKNLKINIKKWKKVKEKETELHSESLPNENQTLQIGLKSDVRGKILKIESNIQTER